MRSKYGGSPSLGVGYSITLFGVGWESPPNMFFYMQAGSIFPFGRNETWRWMISAMFGASCVPILHLIGREFLENSEFYRCMANISQSDQYHLPLAWRQFFRIGFF